MATIDRKLARLMRWVLLTVAAFAAISCEMQLGPEVEYESLATRKLRGDAFVRMYTSTWGMIGNDTVHSWFVVKKADETKVTRYEVWPFYQEDGNGYVWRNLMGPEVDLGAGVRVYAECTGEQAETIIAFLENDRLTYPHRETFVLLPGPNCNTFANWVLQQTGWDIPMPDGAVGQEWTE